MEREQGAGWLRRKASDGQEAPAWMEAHRLLAAADDALRLQ